MRKVFLFFTAPFMAFLFLTTAHAQNNGDSLTEGLFGYWPFDRSARDESINNFLLTIQGAALDTDPDGHSVHACGFDGLQDSGMNVEHNPAQNPDNLTLATWFIKNEPTDRRTTLVYKRNEQEQSGYSLFLTVDKTLAFEYYNQAGQLKRAETNVTLPDNQYHHVAVTFDTTMGKTHIYLNGEMHTAIDTRDQIKHTTNNLYLANNQGGNQGLPGIIDNVRMYDRPLDGPAIRKLFGRERVGNTQTLSLDDNQDIILFLPNILAAGTNEGEAPALEAEMKLLDEFLGQNRILFEITDLFEKGGSQQP